MIVMGEDSVNETVNDKHPFDIEGGLLHDNGDGTVNVSAMTIRFKDYFDDCCMDSNKCFEPLSDNLRLGDHSERTAAEGVEETLRWRQGGQQPSLADLVDWGEAPDWVEFAIQHKHGAIDWVMGPDKPYLKNEKWHGGGFGAMTYKADAPLAHDWRTPLKRTVDHTYTDEEPEHRLRYRDSGVPSDMPYAEIPMTEQEDEEFELMCVRRSLDGSETEMRWHEVEPKKPKDNGELVDFVQFAKKIRGAFYHKNVELKSRNRNDGGS